MNNELELVMIPNSYIVKGKFLKRKIQLSIKDIKNMNTKEAVLRKVVFLCTLILCIGCNSQNIKENSSTEINEPITKEAEDIKVNEELVIQDEINSEVEIAKEKNPDTVNEELEEKQELPNNIIFHFVDIEEDSRVKDAVYESYNNIVEDFDIDNQGDINIYIYKDQATFWFNTFDSENNMVTTGYGNEEERIIHVTSPNDTSIKVEEEMLKVPVHEMIHVLLPHSYLDIREGIAYYLAGQLKDYKIEDIPDNLSTLITYQGNADTIRMSYNLAGYKTKFIIEECLLNDYEMYLTFMENPDDYTYVGFESEQDFIEAYRTYLENHASI